MAVDNAQFDLLYPVSAESGCVFRVAWGHELPLVPPFDIDTSLLPRRKDITNISDA